VLDTNLGPVNLRRAARSSGEAVFFTSCTILIAVSRSTAWLVETRDTFEPGRLVSFVAEGPRTLPKQDSEFVPESLDSRRCRCVASSDTSTSPSGEPVCPKSFSTGESSCVLICWRSLEVRCAYREETEEGEWTTFGASDGEFVFVLGFDSLLWGGWWAAVALWAFPISSRGAVYYEQKAPSRSDAEHGGELMGF